MPPPRGSPGPGKRRRRARPVPPSSESFPRPARCGRGRREGVLEQAARKSGHRCPYGGAEVSMAGSYSADLRGRVLATVEAGATPGAAARRFAVGRSTAYRWAAEARTEGRRAAKRVGGGPKPRITGEVEAALLGLLRGANHLTLAECRDRLAAATGVRVHPWTVGRALRRCGWT